MNLTIYSTKNCSDCKETKKWLNNQNVMYAEVFLEDNPEAIAFVEKVNNGYQSIPTVVFPDGTTLSEPSQRELREKLDSLQGHL